jgi:hypothetical protein
MSQSLITALLLYPSVRQEILSLASKVDGEEKARQFVDDIDQTLQQIGEVVYETKLFSLDDDNEVIQQLRQGSRELRAVAARYRNLGSTGNQLAELFVQLSDWLDSLCPAKTAWFSRN